MQDLPYKIDDLKNALKNDRIVWRNHALDKLIERNILRREAKEAITNGEIIEQYPTDKPYMSCLVFGHTIKRRPLHVVCAFNDDIIYIITVYEPNTIKWEDDLKTRR